MLIQPRMLFAAFSAGSQYWLLLSLLFTKILKSFSAELHPGELVPARYSWKEFFLLRHRTLLLSFVRFPKVLVCRFIQSV